MNIDKYPNEKEIYAAIDTYENQLYFDATKIAKQVGNTRAANLVLLGAAATHIPIKERALIAAIKTLFNRKGDRIVDINLKAFEAGKLYAKEHSLSLSE